MNETYSLPPNSQSLTKIEFLQWPLQNLPDLETLRKEAPDEESGIPYQYETRDSLIDPKW